MSWDSYIENVCGHALGSCDQVAIISLAGGSSWTSHAHANSLKLTAQEGKVIADAMNNDDPGTFQANGIHADGVKYQFLRMDEGIVYGKKKDCGSITMQKTKTAILIAHTAEGKQHGDTNKAVDTIVQYLEGLNM